MGGNRQGGFTLLEMLVVMVIIGLLAGLVGPRLFGKVDSSKVQTAKTQIKMLKSALGILHLDVGVFPPAEQGLKWLTAAPSAPPQRGLWKRPYVNLEWALVADGVPLSDVYKMLSTPEGVDRLIDHALCSLMVGDRRGIRDGLTAHLLDLAHHRALERRRAGEDLLAPALLPAVTPTAGDRAVMAEAG